MAAVATAATALVAATAPAHAAGASPLSEAGVAAPADPAVAQALADALSQDVVAWAPDATESAPTPTEPTLQTPDTGQYQPEEPQYHGEYQPPPTPEPPPPTPEPLPTPTDDAVAVVAPAAPAAPVNVNVSIRVLSPGNDGAVNQANSTTAPAAPAVATTSDDDAGSVAVSVNVNVTANWNIIWNIADVDKRYHPDEKQYHNPEQIESLITGQIGTYIPAQIDAPGLPSLVPETPARSDVWAAPAPGQVPPTSPLHLRPASGRGKGGATASPTSPERGTAALELVVAATSPLAAWTRASDQVRRSTPHGDEPAGGPRRAPLRAPSAPTPPTPLQLAGSGASGGSPFGSAFNTLAVLIAALGVAALRSSRRLRLPSRPVQEADAPRPEKPG